MNRMLLLLLMGLSVSCSDRTPAVRTPAVPERVRSQNSGLGSVTSVEAVHIAEGFMVWRNGQEAVVQDGLLIRVDVAKQGLFFPRALTPPLFVLGGSVGLMLLTPFETGKAVLLMDAPPPDVDVALWMTEPGVNARSLRGADLRAQQRSALSLDASSGVNIHTPPANAPRTHYPTHQALMDTLISLRVTPDICDDVGKECGVVPETTIGRIDCGEC